MLNYFVIAMARRYFLVLALIQIFHRGITKWRLNMLSVDPDTKHGLGSLVLPRHELHDALVDPLPDLAGHLSLLCRLPVLHILVSSELVQSDGHKDSYQQH